MGIAVLLTVLKARKFLILWSILTTGAVAAAAGLILPKQYEATAVVQVDSIQKNALTGLVEPRNRVGEFLGQQAAIAASRTVALEVIDTLVERGYLTMMDFEDQWRDQTGGEIVPGNDARLWAADQLLESLTIKSVAIESTLAITFRSDAPAQSARVANAFSDAYMKTVLQKRQGRASRNAIEFGQERRSLESEIETAQQELTEFRQDAGIVAFGAQRLEAAEVELASLIARLAEARADRAESASLLQQVQHGGGPALLTIPLPLDLLYARQAQEQLGVVISEMGLIGDRYSPEYPGFNEAEKNKKILETSIMDAVKNRSEYHNRRANALEQAVSALKAEVVELQETKQNYDVLEKKVEASRDTYDLVASRSLEETLQSRVGNVTTFLLARAVPAANPATPPYPVIVIIGVLAGAFLGAAAAVAVEFHEGRLRTAAAVRQILGTKVLAEIPSSGRRVIVPKQNGRLAA